MATSNLQKKEKEERAPFLPPGTHSAVRLVHMELRGLTDIAVLSPACSLEPSGQHLKTLTPGFLPRDSILIGSGYDLSIRLYKTSSQAIAMCSWDGKALLGTSRALQRKKLPAGSCLSSGCPLPIWEEGGGVEWGKGEMARNGWDSIFITAC